MLLAVSRHFLREPLGDDHRDIVLSTAQVGQIDELPYSTGTRVLRDDVGDLPIADVAGQAVAAQDQNIARCGYKALYFYMYVAGYSQATRDSTAPGVLFGLLGRQIPQRTISATQEWSFVSWVIWPLCTR